MKTLLINRQPVWRTAFVAGLALFMSSECSLASPEWCDVIFKSATVGRVEVQSSQGLAEMFPGAGMGAPKVYWRPPHTGDKIDLVLGYTPGEHNQYGPPAIVGPQGPLQGGGVQARLRSRMPTNEVTLTLRDDRGHVWSYSGDQLEWGPDRYGVRQFAVDFAPIGAPAREVILALRQSKSLTVDVRNGARLVQSARFDLSAAARRDRFASVALSRLRRHDPRACTTKPPPGPPVVYMQPGVVRRP